MMMTEREADDADVAAFLDAARELVEGTQTDAAAAFALLGVPAPDWAVRQSERVRAAREAEPGETAVRVDVRPATLWDAVLVALESDEFTEGAPGIVYGEDGSVCAWGVVHAILGRAGVTFGTIQELETLLPRWRQVEAAASRQLGTGSIADAFDAGASFGRIAAALRQARDNDTGTGGIGG